ncbi:hypothetical protein BGZ50_005727 [Haplosporangium sp. Z 11]|nr:hypothetical protein BGZ50_005727 [Haplosporangium sp. Z 11]
MARGQVYPHEGVWNCHRRGQLILSGCSVDRSQDASSVDPMRPRFRISKLDDIVNYRKSTWRDDATAVLSQIVLLMRKVHPEVPSRELRHKRQKSSGGGSADYAQVLLLLRLLQPDKAG